MIFPSGEKEFEVLAAWARNIFLAGNIIGAGNAVGAFGPNVKDWDDNGFAAGGTTTGNSCSDTRLLESCRSLGPQLQPPAPMGMVTQGLILLNFVCV